MAIPITVFGNWTLYQALKSRDELKHCKGRAEPFSASLLAERVTSALWGKWRMQGNTSAGQDYSPPSLFSSPPASVHPSFLSFVAAIQRAWQWKNCSCSSWISFLFIYLFHASWSNVKCNPSCRSFPFWLVKTILAHNTPPLTESPQHS